MSFIFKIVSFFGSNSGLYVLAGALISLVLAWVGWLFYALDEARLANELLKRDLNTTLEANVKFEADLKALEQRKTQELQALASVSKANEKLNERVVYVQKILYKNKDNNLTELFNAVLECLWGEDANTSCQAK
ncbi:hypothetical protein DMB95_00030 [Campylobacter sp. MIT 12-8780]|uniref:hypothetical protein n=1 Tax=Campylobacter sp. MIT 12-8780 TaxID=2202200 RepID=UPI00115E8D5B|nr:hypothetical protein [Campylobacter sp. MIT 12-8780]TQR42924.1 hypothetical protein DMB95_00030 [Campylobacter sp. MIT 12-8780]